MVRQKELIYSLSLRQDTSSPSMHTLVIEYSAKL